MSEIPLIHSYTRHEAIADGVLVDIEKDFAGMSKQIGFEFPICLTAKAFNRYVALNTNAKKALEDPKGRMWDVLWMLRIRIKLIKLSSDNKKLDNIKFSFLCTVPSEDEPFAIETLPPSDEEDEEVFLEEMASYLQQNKRLCWLKAVIGPDDEGKGCITIMLPWED